MRTDIHRPKAIVPDNYEFVACECLPITGIESVYAILEARARIKEHMERTGGTYSRHEHGGNCGVCGSVNVVYTLLFYHRPTNTYIRVGNDCATKMDMGGQAEMNAFRAHVHNALDAKAGKAKAQAILEEAGLARCWEICSTYQHPFTFHFEHATREDVDDAKRDAKLKEEFTVTSIVWNLIKYGSLSPAQAQLLAKLLVRIDERPAREAAEAAEREAAEPCPTGRIVITGVVLGLKEQGTDFGMVTRVLVKDDRGFKVWGSRTANCNRGDRVTFTASVTPSNDDPKFGFFKRPAKGSILVAAEPAYDGYTDPRGTSL